MKLRTRVDGALVIALAAILLVTVVAWSASVRFVSTVQRVEQSRNVAESLDSVLEDMIDIETSVRGFAITGDETFLEPYLKATQALPAHQRVLRDALAIRPAQTSRELELERAIQDKLGHAASVIELRRTLGQTAALAAVQRGAGNDRMSRIRALTAELDHAEDVLIQQGKDETEANARIMVITSTASTLVMILLVVGGIVMVRRSIVRPLAALVDAAHRAGTADWQPRLRKRDDELGDLERALARMVEQRQLAERRTRELVEDAPEPFFLADLDGHYTDVNAAACQLLGYTREELLGKSIADLLAPEDLPRLAQSREQLLVTGAKAVDEWRVRNAAGEFVPVEVSTKILPDGRWQAFVHDLTDRKRLEEERQNVLRAREAMIEIVSHDLKSPLNAIELRERLLARQVQHPHVVEHAAAMRRAIVAMQRMIRGLLDGASLEANALQLNIAEHDVAEVIEEVVDVLAPVAADLEIELHVRADRGLLCPFDRDRIAQVIYNLLGNALKFTPRGGRVAIAVEACSDDVAIAIADTGAGIAPEALPRIFDRFFTAGGRYGGTGLGLDIAKGLVEAHGGTITASSTVGQGSSFRFTIPTTASCPSSTGTASHQSP